MSSRTLSSFRSQLKTYLFPSSFPGYYTIILAAKWLQCLCTHYPLKIISCMYGNHPLPAVRLYCRKAKLCELTGWPLSDKCFTMQSRTSYKDCCRRCCEIFGNGAAGDTVLDVSVPCTHCSTSLCTCIHGSECRDLHEELIVFDFGSKTTWFKYTGDAGIGQLSMHPTIQPLNGSLGAFSDDLCLVCSRTAFRHSQPLPGEDATSPRKSSKTFSKRSLRNLDCFGSSCSRDDEVECVRFSAMSPDVNRSSMDEEMRASEPGDVQVYEFLIRHIIKRNPCFQISNIPFVICQSTDADELTKNRLIRMLICQLKVPE